MLREWEDQALRKSVSARMSKCSIGDGGAGKTTDNSQGPFGNRIFGISCQWGLSFVPVFRFSLGDIGRLVFDSVSCSKNGLAGATTCTTLPAIYICLQTNFIAFENARDFPALYSNP
jgi:hypothetical protein